MESVQDPVLSVPSAVPAESRDLARHQAPGFVGRAGLRSGVNPSHNIVVSGDNAAGSRVQKEVDSCELVFRAASEMDNPGILRVLRSSPRALPDAVSAPGQSSAGPGQSSGQVRPGQTGSREQGSESGASAAGGGTPGRGGLRQLGSQDRSGTGQSLLTGNIPVQADGVPVEPEQGLDQGAEVALPLLRRGSRVKTKVIPYQARDSGMG